MAKKEEREFTAECTVTVVVYAECFDEAQEMIMGKLDSIGMNGEVTDIQDENGDTEEPEVDEDEEEVE